MILSVEQEWKSKENNKRITDFFNTLLFETPSGQRFTTDSPILGNVWLSFARNPLEPVDLILSIQRDRSTGQAAKQIREMINRLRYGEHDSNGELIRLPAPDLGPLKQVEKLSPRITYIPGQIAARFYFDELMRIALPLCPWWQKTIDQLNRLNSYNGNAAQAWSPDWSQFPIDDDNGKMSHLMTQGLMLMRQGIGGTVIDESDNHKENYVRELPVDLLWMIRMAGVISYIIHNLDHSHEESNLVTSYQLDFERENDILTLIENDFLYRTFDAKGNTVHPQSAHTRKINGKKAKPVEPIVRVEQAKNARCCIADHFFKLFENWRCKDTRQPDYFVWRVTRNRTAELAVNESSKTVKADAARRLFDTSCKDITWAIIDSGIDKNHHAFKDAQGSDSDVNIDLLPTRVIKTLDFTHLRDLLDFEVLSFAGNNPDASDKPNDVKKTDDKKTAANEVYENLFEGLVSKRLYKYQAGEGVKTESEIRLEVADELKRLANRIEKGNDIDWETLEPLIVDHNPGVPANDHGTHVGGILAADWVEEHEQTEKPLNQRPRRMMGVCPDINLIDCRVLREQGDTDEFEILAAIQFLRWLNSRAGHTVVHGANISMSLIHEVRRYACGQTPVCIECNEAVSLGMVIVAAAGNRGHDVVEDFVITGRTKDYRAMSVTDPGNAEHVITVGSTHRKRPHDYGVSFFSSRGPTGDGRVKPDIVAPGERIEGPIPRGGIERKDGTSMAAPHVSGAAAMLMARHKELVGNPKKIKKVLCETATNLERQNYFQGHGLVDVLRALQSV